MPPYAYSLELSGGRAFALRSSVPLAFDKDNTVWVHVGYVGEWKGHPQGPFSLTDADFRSCVAWSERRQTPIPWDYNHASLRSDSAEANRSAGTVLRMEVRGEDLWALTEFTPQAAEYIRAKEYRFCSGVFLWDWPDPETGETWPCVLRSIALTNEPFVDGQVPIALSLRALSASGGTMKITKDAFLSELKKLEGEEFDASQLHALVDGIAAMEAARNPEAAEMAPAVDCAPAGELATADANTDTKALSSSAALSPPPAVPPAAPAPMPMAAPDAADPATMVMAKLTELTGLDAAAILAACQSNPDGIKQALTAAPSIPLSQPKPGVVTVNLNSPVVSPDPATAALQATVEAQAVELSAFRANAAKAKADEAKAADDAIVAEVDAVITAGKVPAATREHWLSCARSSIGTFRALTAKLPALAAVPLGRDAPQAAPPTAPLATTGRNILDPKSVPDTDPALVERAASIMKWPHIKGDQARALSLARQVLDREQALAG